MGAARSARTAISTSVAGVWRGASTIGGISIPTPVLAAIMQMAQLSELGGALSRGAPAGALGRQQLGSVLKKNATVFPSAPRASVPSTPMAPRVCPGTITHVHSAHQSANRILPMRPPMDWQYNVPPIRNKL